MKSNAQAKSVTEQTEHGGSDFIDTAVGAAVVTGVLMGIFVVFTVIDLLIK